MERLQIQIVLSFIFHISVSWFIHRVGNERSRASPRLKDALLNFVKFKSLLSCHPEVLSLSLESKCAIAKTMLTFIFCLMKCRVDTNYHYKYLCTNLTEVKSLDHSCNKYTQQNFFLSYPNEERIWRS